MKSYIKYFLLVLLASSISGCGTSLLFLKKYEEPEGDTTALTFSAPWITKAGTFEFRKNVSLTLWDYTDPENKKLLGVILLSADKKSKTVRISTGHPLAMHTAYTWVDAGVQTTCGNNFKITPEQGLSYELLFMYPVPTKAGKEGCASMIWGKKPGSNKKIKIKITHLKKI
jgi:hypothetical protein